MTQALQSRLFFQDVMDYDPNAGNFTISTDSSVIEGTRDSTLVEDQKANSLSSSATSRLNSTSSNSESSLKRRSSIPATFISPNNKSAKTNCVKTTSVPATPLTSRPKRSYAFRVRNEIFTLKASSSIFYVIASAFFDYGMGRDNFRNLKKKALKIIEK